MFQGQDQAIQARDIALQLKMNGFYLDDFLIFRQMQDKLMFFLPLPQL